MKKKIFDRGLYLEGLRQTRTIALFYTIVTALVGLLVNVGVWVSYSSYSEEYRSELPILQSVPEIQPALIASFCVLAPILTLKMFHFTTRRRDCDFYHAIPQSRVCLFVSFFAAVQTWIIAAIVIGSLAAAIPCMILPDYLSFSASELFHYALNMYVASLYVSAATALAIGITGTTFTNIVVTLLLIFAPRVISLILTSFITDALPILVDDKYSLFLNNHYNIAVGMVLEAFEGSNWAELFSGIKPCIYTLTVGLIFALLAAGAFHIRKSEHAANPAPNRFLGAIYRLTLAFIVCLLPIRQFFNAIIKQEALDSSEIFGIICFYLIAIAVFIVYELIATHNLKKTLKAMPSLFMLPVVNVLTLVVLVLACRSAIQFDPSVSDIKSVKVIAKEDEDYRYNGSYNYFDNKSQQLDLQDEQVISILVKALSSNRAELTSSYTDFLRTTTASRTYCLETRFTTNSGKTVYRNVFLSEDDKLALEAALSENVDYKKCYMDLPDVNDAGLNIDFYGSLPEESRKKIYSAFCEDVAEMGYSEWFSYYNNYKNRSINISSQFDTMYITVEESGTYSNFNVPVSRDFPHMLNVYFEELQANSSSSTEILKKLSSDSIYTKGSRNTLDYLDCTFTIYYPDGSTKSASVYANRDGQEIIWMGVSDFSLFREIVGQMRSAVGDSFSADKYIICMYVDMSDDGVALESRSAWFAFDELPGVFQELIDNNQTITVQ